MKHPLLHNPSYSTKLLPCLLLGILTILSQAVPSMADADPGGPQLAGLTLEERQWLADHPVLKLGVGVAFPPFQYVEEEDGELVFKGMVAEYILLLEERLGVTLEPVKDISFNEALERGRHGTMDLFPCISWTPERAEYLTFTQPYLDYPLVIITRENAPEVDSIEDLNGMRVAVIKTLATYSKYINDFPHVSMQFVFKEDLPAVLAAVSTGSADACVANLAVASHIIQEQGLSNLRVAATSPWETNKLRMAVPSDKPVLAGIIAKAVDSLTREDHDRIRNRWVHLFVEQNLDWGRVFRYGLPALVGFLLVLATVLFWNRRLARENERRVKAEERFRLAAECASDLVFEWDMLTDSLRWFGGIEHDLGLSEEQTPDTMEKLFQLLHPDDASAMQERAAQRKMDTQLEVANEFRIRHADGRWFTWTYRGRTILDDKGSPVRMVGACSDITAAKASEEALRMREEEYRGIFEAVQDSLFIISKDGRFVEANPAACEQYGYTREELLTLTPHDIIHPDSQHLFQEYTQEIEAVGEFHGLAVDIRKDGSTFPTDVKGTAITFRGEAHFLALIRDVSRQHEAEQAIRDSEAKLAGIVGSITDAMWMVDEHCTLVWANDVTRRLFGSGITSRKSHEVFKSPDFPCPSCDSMESFKNGETREYEVQLPCVDGRIRSFLCTTNVAARHNDDRPKTVVGILKDMTERKRVEEMMIQSEKMISLGGLAAGTAHEINNPLGIILSSAQNALRRLSPDLAANSEPAARHGLDLHKLQAYLQERGVLGYLEHIHGAGKRAGNIVENMLAFSRRSHSSKTPHDLSRILDKALDLAASSYDLKKGFEFKEFSILRQYEPSLPKTLVNETEMEQVFLNLIINAIQSMTVSGHKGIKMLTLAARAEESSVVVEIQDTGPGMDETTRKRIFEPFFTTKELGQGTGLGLSVSYFIVVENHKGAIMVDSAPGMGATFRITLPIVPDGENWPRAEHIRIP